MKYGRVRCGLERQGEAWRSNARVLLLMAKGILCAHGGVPPKAQEVVDYADRLVGFITLNDCPSYVTTPSEEKK